MAGLCLAAAALLVATVLSKYKKSPEQVGSQAVCLALGLWAAVCLISLSLFWGLALFSLSCLLMYTYLSEQEWLPVDQKAVLVTGSDCGFGHAICKHLDKMGFTVFAGVLNEQGSGAEELRRSCSSRLSVLQMDVTKPEQVKDAHSKVVEKVQDKGLWAVINNAGIFGFPADGELIPMNEYKQCMAVNFFGAVEVTKTFLPLLRKSKGRLVNISSMGGVEKFVKSCVISKGIKTFDWANIRKYYQLLAYVNTREPTPDLQPLMVGEGVPMEKMSSYSSTKAALTMFSSVMRQELSKWGVKVAIVQPGGFQTRYSLHGSNILETCLAVAIETQNACAFWPGGHTEGSTIEITGTSDMWEMHEKKILEHLPSEVLADYGEDYILTLKHFLARILDRASPDFSPLILDVQHALCAKHPAAFYCPGKGAFLWLCMASIFPTGLNDYLWKTNTTQAQHLPRALSLPNRNKAM